LFFIQICEDQNKKQKPIVISSSDDDTIEYYDSDGEYPLDVQTELQGIFQSGTAEDLKLFIQKNQDDVKKYFKKIFCSFFIYIESCKHDQRKLDILYAYGFPDDFVVDVDKPNSRYEFAKGLDDRSREFYLGKNYKYLKSLLEDDRVQCKKCKQKFYEDKGEFCCGGLTSEYHKTQNEDFYCDDCIFLNFDDLIGECAECKNPMIEGKCAKECPCCETEMCSQCLNNHSGNFWCRACDTEYCDARDPLEEDGYYECEDCNKTHKNDKSKQVYICNHDHHDPRCVDKKCKDKQCYQCNKPLKFLKPYHEQN
jgi:hypothetical protein